MSRHIVAAVQMNSTADKSENLEVATRLIGTAVERGAELIALPELFNCLAHPDEIVAQAEPIPGPTCDLMSEMAAGYKVTIVAGSIAERDSTNKIYNTSVIFGPDGSQLAQYRKLHLFDIDLPNVTFCESRFMEHGNQLSVTNTSVGRLGQGTCYDLRFPELFRRLVELDAEIFVIPAAFTLATGRDHWEVLLRARAIENQVYVIAPDQFGRHGEGLHTFGRSMIIDPWGTVLATVPDGEGVVTAEIDLDQLRQIRSRLPCLQHRRKLELLAESCRLAVRQDHTSLSVRTK
jgi:predicted amidohydrolase